MLCAEFDRRLQRRLDRRESPQADPRLVRHARRCPACRQMLAMQTLIAEQLTASASPLPPAALTARILARAKQENSVLAAPGPYGPGLAIRRRSWRLAGAALAAALLLGVWPYMWATKSTTNTPTAGTSTPDTSVTETRDSTASLQSAAASTSPAIPRPPEAPKRQDASSAVAIAPPESTEVDPRQRFQLLAAETGQSLAAVVLRLPGIGAEASGADAASSDGKSPWVKDVTGRLKPFAATLTDALSPWLESASPDEPSPRS